MRGKLSTIVLVAFLASTATSGAVMIACAEEPGDAHHGVAAQHEEPPAPSLGELFIPAINFSIYLFIVVRYVIPAMREYLRRRHADIVREASESSASLAKAEQTVASSKARLAGLQTEADAIREDLVVIANRQAARVLAQADESGKRRLADATLVAEQERRRALADIREEVAAKATALAETRIRAALTVDDQRSFVQQFLKDASR
jgi:F-type H+-transporting ATPase subunit b